MNLSGKMAYVFFHLIAKKLPQSHGIISLGISQKIRGCCAKLMLKSCGEHINIEKGASFSTKCTIGDYSGIGINADLGVVHIGKYVMMGPNCTILTVNHSFSRTDIPMLYQGFTKIKPVYIDDDVWIGKNVTILPGVHIGKGAIIGACSVVTHDVSDYDIVAGNPARVIRSRLEGDCKNNAKI